MDSPSPSVQEMAVTCPDNYQTRFFEAVAFALSRFLLRPDPLHDGIAVGDDMNSRPTRSIKFASESDIASISEVLILRRNCVRRKGHNIQKGTVGDHHPVYDQ
jgi:hypothetical protein